MRFLVFSHVLFNQTIDCLSILIIFADSQNRIITGKRTNDFRKLRIIEQARQYGCIIGVQCRLNNIDELNVGDLLNVVTDAIKQPLIFIRMGMQD